MVKVSRTVGYSCYWETYAPTFIQKAQADTFFTQQAQAKFLTSVALFRHFPSSDLPEVAFIGRSNVGKSSLLNALVNAKGLARTSATRGFTKTMNLYGVAPKGNIHVGKTEDGYDNITGAGGLTIVDMPGYGEGSLAEWGVQIMKYLENRKQLRRVFVLIDAMHGIKEKDESILASLRLAAIPHQIILSKLDRIYIPASNSIKSRDGKALKRKGSEKGLDLVMATIREQIQPAHGFGALGELLGVSSEVAVDGKPLGVDALRFAVMQAAGLELGKKPKRVTGNVVRVIEGSVVRPVKVDLK
ncbi:P-loop containing nucleoside triphosphate hydrolase protein [Periconia macrospinosa]|uniref:GTP-binding protein 8 n=1 Tax=Periconia macrospinosa TaxID=97972 RepID=A0A2V1E3M5_9PLEO|nr:P-loop containing nucleoside triphosphate hydrolase protein [Periconia macrospinosa]